MSDDSTETDMLFWLSVLDAARRVGDRLLEQRARAELVKRGVRIVYQPTAGRRRADNTGGDDHDGK